MSTLKVLKEYLIGDDGYLLNDANNGKTVMLSGAWGSGKTHFWQNEIENDLTQKLNKKDKACVYVSLYGKDNIEAIKNEILFKAYESIKDENKLAKRAISAFGFGSRLLSVSIGGVKANTGVVVDGVESFFESKKIDEAESFLADGGLICLDDFERKSRHIDLNDLFGFIAQLAIDMDCKIVIILNSDVFEGKEANVFKTVKEKTVNKFFYFGPTIKELFESIYERDDKHKKLDEYRDEILSTIQKTEELNARIYIQVLDNCFEWINKGYELNVTILKPLVLSSIFFAKYHYSLYIDDLESKDKVYEMYHAFNEHIELAKNIRDMFPQYASDNPISKDDIIHSLKEDVTIKRKDSNDNENAEVYYTSGSKLLEENKQMLRDFYIYKYILKIDDEIEGKLFNEINQFIKTGILMYKEANV